MSHSIEFVDIPAPGPWADFALCKGHTAEFFGSAEVLVSAKKLCAECPVSRPCLAYALRYDVRGTWAGTCWEQRQRMRGGGRRVVGL